LAVVIVFGAACGAARALALAIDVIEALFNPLFNASRTDKAPVLKQVSGFDEKSKHFFSSFPLIAARASPPAAPKNNSCQPRRFAVSSTVQIAARSTAALAPENKCFVKRSVNMPNNLPRLVLFAVFCLMTLALAAHAQTKKPPTSALADGQYTIRATYKLADQPKPIVDFGGSADITFKNDIITMNIPIFPKPVVLKLSNGIFKGRMENNVASVEFQCEIVEANHTEGVFTGTLGSKKVVGIWTMELVNTKEKAPETKGT
jgi:hypothetical protein